MDKMYYGMAALEVSEGNIDASLMIKAMALSGGDEKLGRATYIELRAKEIESEHRKAKVAQAVITTAAVTIVATKAAASATKNSLRNGANSISNFGVKAFQAILIVFAFFIGLSVVGFIGLNLLGGSNSSPVESSSQAVPAPVESNPVEFQQQSDLPNNIPAPVTDDSDSWKNYLSSISVNPEYQKFVTNQTIPFFLPANSRVVDSDPANPEISSPYSRQMDVVKLDINASFAKGNLIVFGSPDSRDMADFIVEAFSAGGSNALNGSYVLFIGKPEDAGRVKAAVESVGATFLFHEVK